MKTNNMPLYLRRRLNFIILSKFFEECLNDAIKKFHELDGNMPLHAFNNYIISNLVMNLYTDTEFEDLDEKYFDEIWDFVTQYYRQRIIDEYSDINEGKTY